MPYARRRDRGGREGPSLLSSRYGAQEQEGDPTGVAFTNPFSHSLTTRPVVFIIRIVVTGEMNDSEHPQVQHPTYRRAPITEAIIDFQFSEPLDGDTCNKVKSKLEEEYPLVIDWSEIGITFDPSAKATDVQEKVRGFKLSSVDQTDIVIAANTRFAVSRLAPYQGWEPFRTRAVRNWKSFKSVAGYRKIKRVGIRYINRIDIPRPANELIELSDYLLLEVHVPQPPFPPIVQQTTQAIFRFDDCMVVVHMATVPSPLLNHASFALDIDFGREVNVPQADDGLWSYIEQIRDRKNVLFEACITERTRRMFD